MAKKGAKMSLSDSHRSPSSKTYVDNDENRRMGRVGMVKGSAVYSRAEQTLTVKMDQLNLSGSSKKVKSGQRASAGASMGAVPRPAGSRDGPTHRSSSGKVYEDNDFNRKHNRVGKPKGSAPVSNNSR
ncbi:uncharacterized protein LOC131934612 [Physella acuta]|uniref:uncharacterized protein LOC131934612 n=1 Tax=Physella acuta TaxID=109671 RepID=UPI0027DD021E|nr:uncharacterized protein LOC131934612 [Physella acuta]